MLLRWLGRLAALCHERAQDIDAERDRDDASDGDDECGVPVHFVVEGVEDLRAVADHEDGEDEKAQELAAEHGDGEQNRLHFKYAGGKLDHLERKGRRNHGRDDNGEKLLFLEAVAQGFVSGTVDFFEQEKLSACATDQVRDETSEG
mgnify:CR=1 FL=1